MAVVEWPAYLPQDILFDGFNYAIGDNLLRTENDGGATKVRPRTTRTIDTMSVAFMMTNTEWIAFRSFYRIDLANGSKAFEFVTPYTGDTDLYRVSAPPTMEPQGPNDVKVSMVWEKLP